FWQDRYHATAVESDRHLLRCMTYIDLNMVRAGAVAHPSQWRESGYCEIQRLPQRYRIIDRAALGQLLECRSPEALRSRLAAATELALQSRRVHREDAWTESLAVGSEGFLLQFRTALGARARARQLVDDGDLSCLKEPAARYD